MCGGGGPRGGGGPLISRGPLNGPGPGKGPLQHIIKQYICDINILVHVLSFLSLQSIQVSTK